MDQYSNTYSSIYISISSSIYSIYSSIYSIYNSIYSIYSSIYIVVPIVVSIENIYSLKIDSNIVKYQ